MTSLLTIALASSLLSQSETVSRGTSSAPQPPLILSQSTKLIDFRYNGEIWLKDGYFVLQGVSCKGIRMSRVAGAELTKVSTDGADIGLWIIGGGNITVRNSVFRNHRVGIEGGPGDPWTWANEAQLRGIGSGKDAEWKLGMNLCGMLETRNAGISFYGNGTNRVTLPLRDCPNPPYKLDYLPLAGNHWDVSEKKFPKVVAETKYSYTLEAEGVFEAGKKYWAHTYNRKYEIHDINIFNSRFEKNSLAGISLYFVNRTTIQNNYAPDVTSDYEFGLEHARNAYILDNKGSTSGHHNIRIGLLGRMENIVMMRNTLPLAYMDRNQPELGVYGDTPINYTGGHRSPFLQSTPVVIKP